MNKQKIGVIFGGRSGEHEVSLVSATSIIEALDRNRFEVVPIGISKEGHWYTGAGVMEFLKGRPSAGPAHAAILLPDNEGGLLTWDEGRGRERLDCVFPVLHGPYGEDGTVQGLLELAGVPYVGCGVMASSLAMDKVVSKALFLSLDLPTAPYIWFHSSGWKADEEGVIADIEKELSYPVFIKPANMGSSVGIFKAHDRNELSDAVPQSMQYDRKVLVEEAVEDAMEIEVSVLGNDEPEASVPGEIIPSNEFYDYDAKYVDGKSTDKIPADLPKNVIERIRELAVESFRAIDGSGLARVDFLVTRKTHEIFLNELNTIPGFTSISMYPKLWEATGLGYSDLLTRLVDLAFERHAVKSSLATSYQPKEDWYK
ncbi:MAG: D-alanine--D-alanine ligase [Deltaproteobacteria bacterium]|nr:D-alanine--D-alanine ligase [Candidatus Zymogenaceae bacterium]